MSKVRTDPIFPIDGAGRLQTFTNRNGNTQIQTFEYDALNRLKDFYWNDGSTPRVDFGYDAASRVTSINNANATIQRLYWNDNLLGAETETITGGNAKTVMCFYDDDSNRAQIYYPDGNYIFPYTYTWRNQLKDVNGYATYDYDLNGNLKTRALNNGTHTDYAYDGLDRMTWVTHSFGRWFNYGYYDNTNNRKYTRRYNGQAVVGEVFGYDLADQASGVRLNVADPGPTPAVPSRSIIYDANGNRTSFASDTYTINNNNLNQYNKRNNINASYDFKGNLTTGFDGSAYTYDAQNRLLTASNMSFTYDGLNRQVTRTDSLGTTYNVWDGWNLIEEYQAGGTPTAYYLHGAGGLIVAAQQGQLNYYYQDGSGSTSHVTDENGTVKEWYRYDLQGTPIVNNDPNNHASAFGVRHLFTGQQWYKDIGLYDLRNRFYSPDMGRFLQPDPIGFRGDRTNLYRYCRNNPVTRADPFGLWGPLKPDPGGVIVTGTYPNNPQIVRVDVGSPAEGPGGGPGGGEPGGIDRNNSDNPRDHLPLFTPPMDIPIPLPPPVPDIPLLIDPSHPETTAEFIAAGNMIEHGNTMDTTPAIDPISVASGAFAARAVLTVGVRAAATELSLIRSTRAGETFIRYESANPAFSRVTASGGVTPGTYAAPVSNGVVSLELRASTYNLPRPDILRPNAITLRPPTGTPIIGPRSVLGGTGDEVIFPFGY